MSADRARGPVNDGQPDLPVEQPAVTVIVGLPGDQLLAHGHQREAEQVLATPGPGVCRSRIVLGESNTPDQVYRTGFDQNLVAGTHQKSLQRRVLRELGQIAGDHDLDARLAGVVLSDLSDSQRRPGLSGSVAKSVERSSRAYASGLRPGDVIVGVNQRDIEDTGELADLLQRTPRQLLLTVVRGQSVFYLLLK